MSIKKEAKAIRKSSNFPYYITCLCALNDGRLAIGGNSIVIYNMKSYKIDIFINDSSNILIPLKGNKLFNIQISNYWFNESVSCHLIEYTKNDFVDKTDMLPNKSDYNIDVNYLIIVY